MQTRRTKNEEARRDANLKDEIVRTERKKNEARHKVIERNV